MTLATFAGGCFWCTESVFRQLRGVLRVTSGYIGGHTPQPDYRSVCNGNTGHAEAVEIEFDESQISYRQLLEVFFATHDPTTLNRQGHDVGTQYRSAVFWHSDAQLAEARDIIGELDSQQVFGQPIVTRLEEAQTFHPAEGYHQGYYAANAGQPYCEAVIAPKLRKFRQTFTSLLRD
ncbi:peptide-methionine (S)-S-oxide reductase MsrA [uncultured Aquitalea sp.]|uniref:peptide-methionine (S)-S-oxide reductase MsrA n=1 Tax=uncultured Aquitalea sp. TaxID=540272 RepID=UPI0025E174DB|nr:peptide-methionine (S)-S-oxide reductase MsrA [uncultured Aquitalea sp.]